MLNVNVAKRLESVDALKGFAIYLVIWGHALQYFRNERCFHNDVFAFVYSFHMPLFFLLSGLFFRSSLKLSYKDFLINKSKQLLLPCIVWGALFFLIQFFIDFGNGKEVVDTRRWPKKIFQEAENVWFLRELFVSYLITYTSLRLLKKDWLACTVSIAFVLVAPYCGMQRFLLPLFWLGVFVKSNFSSFMKYPTRIALISGACFFVSQFYWSGDYTIYVTPFSPLIEYGTHKLNLNYLGVSMFRLFVGGCGSVFFLALFHIIYSRNRIIGLLSKIGTRTLEVYLLQRLFLENLLSRVVDFQGVNIWVYNMLLTPLISVAILFVCIAVIVGVDKIGSLKRGEVVVGVSS